MQKIKKTVGDCWREYGDTYMTAGDRAGFIKRTVKEVKASNRHVSDWLTSKRIWPLRNNVLPVTSTKVAMTGSRKTMSIDETVQPYDMPGKVLQIIGTMRDDEVITDVDLMRELALGESRWRAIRGSTRLSGYWCAMPDKTLRWGTKRAVLKLMERMKERT